MKNITTGNTLIKNFSFTILINIANLISPIIVLPYILNILGIEKFGIIILTQSIMSYFIVIVDYGFNITAVQMCSINRENKAILSDIISNVLTTKFYLVFLCLIVCIVLLLIMPNFSSDYFLFLSSFGLIIAKTVFPIWFFQGIEQIKYAAFFNILAKIFLFILIMYFIVEKNDYKYVNLFFAVGDIFMGIISLFFIKYYWNIDIKYTSWEKTYNNIKEDFPLVLTNLSIVTYSGMNIVILSLFASPLIIGAYAVAEKVVITIKFMVGIILQSTFSYASRLAENSINKYTLFLRYEFIALASFFSIAGIMLFLTSNYLSILLTKDLNKSLEVSNYIKLMSFIPLIVSLNTPAYQTLLIHNKKRIYLLVIGIGTIMNLALNFILAKYFFAIGTIITIIITELFITFGLIFFASREKIFFKLI